MSKDTSYRDASQLKMPEATYNQTGYWGTIKKQYMIFLYTHCMLLTKILL